MTQTLVATCDADLKLAVHQYCAHRGWSMADLIRTLLKTYLKREGFYPPRACSSVTAEVKLTFNTRPTNAKHLQAMPIGQCMDTLTTLPTQAAVDLINGMDDAAKKEALMEFLVRHRHAKQ
ncbi:hypothetical protein ACO0LG_08630 [Undibacterium sp. Ji42W]|uniref:hypothetical protein n=1 Tax=Undibacterium sp. Ji42W TaxID=3413039 RepID=UPI003BF063F9